MDHSTHDSAKAAVRVTKLEAEVLAEIIAGRDPWFGSSGQGGWSSRRYSQAIARLQRKGVIRETITNGKCRYEVVSLATAGAVGVDGDGMEAT